jgi:hypothetical protein
LELQVQGTEASEAPGDSRITLEAGRERIDLPCTVVRLGWLDGMNRPLEATRHAVGVSREITHWDSLPRDFTYDQPSPDVDNLRSEVWDPSIEVDEIEAVLESVDPVTRTLRGSLRLKLHRPDRSSPFRSAYVRLVADRTDLRAPGVRDQVLLVALRDSVRLRYATAGGSAEQQLRVGRPGREDGPQAARRATLRLRVLRTRPDGPPVIGTDEASAVRIGREQVQIANEVWLQCYIDFGRPKDADVAVVAPPPPSLLAVADGDGLPAKGDGHISFRADGYPIQGLPTRRGDRPVQTALRIAEALKRAGFVPQVTENPATEFGAGRSADILVRDNSGHLVHLEPIEDGPVSSDARQKVMIGVVDLSDGLQEFNNMNAAAGSLEERALVKALADDDPTTVDVFVVNRFTQGTRQGEAFIKGSEGAIINTLILDRNGLRQQRTAWTMPHELGHVLLNHPYHPDNFGPDRPWLLMDSDNNRGLVSGPKRLTEEECQRVRAQSDVHTIPPLLRRHASQSWRPIPSLPIARHGQPPAR